MKTVILRGVSYPKYAVTEDGGVCSLGQRPVWMKPHPDKDGYEKIQLYQGGGRYIHASVHQIVCETYHGPRPDGMRTNHKDGCKQNNHVNNLEWVTRSENRLHAYAMGLQVPPNQKSVVGIRISDGLMMEWPSIASASRAVTGKTQSGNIQRSLRGGRWNAYGWAWQYT